MTRNTRLNSKIKVFLVDDHELVRDGIKARLAAEPLVQVIGEAANGLDAISALTTPYADQPDIVLMDINLPDITGLEATRRLLGSHPNLRILILSVHDEREYIEQAIQRGAVGYILKDAPVEDMVNAIARCHGGENYFSAKATMKLAQKSPDIGGDYRGLSRREREILSLIADGLTNKEVAREFGISVRTAETHRQNIREKLGAKNAADLTRVALSLGLV